MKLHERLERQQMSKTMLDAQLMFMDIEEISMMNKHIIIGEYTVSVQCSSGHYCEPRKSFLDMSKYSKMEMALWLTDGGCFSEPHNFSDFKFIKELENAFYGGVYGWVDVDILEKFIQFLETKED